jgi:cysteine desulfurase / selenocysteine lyase
MMESARGGAEAIDWERVRGEFPAALEYVYLNGAAASPIPRSVARAGARYYEEMAAAGDLPWEKWLDATEAVRRSFASWINAPSPCIAFTLNTSVAMNLIAGILGKRGSVVTMSDEFPAATLPWLHQGYAVTFVPSQEDGTIPPELVRAAIRPDTRVLVCSQVQFATGFRSDLLGLRQLCDERGLTFVVDATQGLGALPIDVADLRPDFLVCSGYKWLLAGYGVAALYVAPHLVDTSTFPMAGWMSVRDPENVVNNVLDLKDTVAELEVGCPNFAGIYSLGAALAFLEELGPTTIERRVRDLTDYLHRALGEAGIPICSTTSPEHRSGISVAGCDNAPAVVAALKRKKIFVSARGRGIRISTHIYNSCADIDAMTRELRVMATNR